MFVSFYISNIRLATNVVCPMEWNTICECNNNVLMKKFNLNNEVNLWHSLTMIKAPHNSNAGKETIFKVATRNFIQTNL